MSAVVTLLAGLSAVQAQQATEQFIPIGQSPGLSHKLTSIAKIEATDPKNRTMILSGVPEGHSVLVTERTQIWLDRTGLNKTNLTGGYADLKPGLQVEVKYEDSGAKKVAEWIKVIPQSAQ